MISSHQYFFEQPTNQLLTTVKIIFIDYEFFYRLYEL